MERRRNRTTPDFDITCTLDGQLFYTERRNAEIGQAPNRRIYHLLRSLGGGAGYAYGGLDGGCLSEITEAYETNNDTSLTFESQMPNQPPTIQVTRPTFGDTSAGQFVIRWTDEDPDDNALVYLYWTLDTMSVMGNVIPGATGIFEDDEADSFQWTFSAVPPGPVWILAMILDEALSAYDFSEGPLIVDYNWNAIGEAPGGEIRNRSLCRASTRIH